MVAENDMI